MKLKVLFDENGKLAASPPWNTFAVYEDDGLFKFFLTQKGLDDIVTEHCRTAKPQQLSGFGDWQYADGSRLSAKQIEEAAKAIYYKCLEHGGQINSWHAPSVPEKMRADYRAVAIEAAPHLQFPLRDPTNDEIRAIVADSISTDSYRNRIGLTVSQCEFALFQWLRRLNDSTPISDPRLKIIENCLEQRDAPTTGTQAHRILDSLLASGIIPGVRDVIPPVESKKVVIVDQRRRKIKAGLEKHNIMISEEYVDSVIAALDSSD